MQRRTFVALTSFVGGGSLISYITLAPTDRAGERSANVAPELTDTPTPARTQLSTETGTPTETATSQPTETATSQPTETSTETATPTQAEQEGAEQLAIAAAELGDIVAMFTRGYGSELTDVTATSTEFRGLTTTVEIQSAKAQEEYLEARDVAANQQQRMTADWMEGCWRFLRALFRTQSEVVDGYEHLVAVYAAFEQVNGSHARDQINRLGAKRRQSAGRYDTLTSISTVEEVTVIEEITPTEYQEKLAQLDSDIGMYGQLDDPLRTYADGIKWLGRAQTELAKDDRNVQAAKDRAEWAKEDLNEARSQLRTVRGDADEAYTFKPMLDSLISLIPEKISAANEILD